MRELVEVQGRLRRAQKLRQVVKQTDGSNDGEALGAGHVPGG
jgi:hypothetical protein